MRGVASSHLSILPLAVHLFTGRCGAGLPGPGPPLPLLLLHLSVLPTEQKRGAAQRRLLLHGLVCHHRDPRLQVGLNSLPRYKKGGIKVEKSGEELTSADVMLAVSHSLLPQPPEC